MAGPWEKYASPQPQDQARPWSRFSAPAAPVDDYVMPEPPAGVTIHTGKGPVYSQGGGKMVPTTEAEAMARMMRERDGVAGDVADSVAEGIPFVGPFLGRARAGAKALMGNGDYAGNLEMEQAKARTFAQDYPYLSTTAKVGGAVAGSLSAAGLAARAPGAVGTLGGWLTGGGANSIRGAVARGAFAGGLQGAAQGAGETRDLTSGQAVIDAGMGAMIGTAIGGTIPAAVAGGAKIADALRNREADALSSLSGRAQRYITSQLGDPEKLAMQRQQIEALGPEGMLADVSPEWMGVARGAASRPGSREAIVNPLLERDAAKNTRIGEAIRQNAGEAVSPMTVETKLHEARKALSPEYTAVFANAKAVDTSGLATKLDAMAVDARGAAANAAREVRGMLNISGTDVLDPNPATLHQTRQAIDGMLNSTTDGNALRVLRSARRAIDEELAAKVPGIKEVDAKWASLARQGEAFEGGRKAFSSGENPVWPDELKAQVGKLDDSARQRMTEGARAKIEEIVGQNANDVAALRRLMKGEGDWNRAKLATLFGEEKADRILRTLDNETLMENTARRVTSGSDTAMAQRFGDALDEMARPSDLIAGDSTMFGSAVGGAKKIARGILGSRAENRAADFADEVGRLSVAKGNERDAVIAALMARGERADTLRGQFGAAGMTGPAAASVLEAIQDRRGISRAGR